MCKSRYNGSLKIYKKRSDFKIADFVWKSIYKFKLVVKLNANKYYIDLFHYLYFLFLAIKLLFFPV